jgi:myosin-1
VEEFEATRHALKVTGFGSKEQEAIFSLIAAILHLGNLKFKEDEKSGACKVNSTTTAAELLGIEPETLARIVTIRHIKTAREEYDVPNNAVQCAQARDALSKVLYFRMFDWIVKRVNSAIANEELSLPYSIGVLDVSTRRATSQVYKRV